MRRRILVSVALISVLTLAASACSKNDSGSSGGSSGGGSDGGGGGGGGTAVSIANFAFDPNTLSVTSGQEVTVSVTNNDTTEHSFTLDDGSGEVDVEPGDAKDLTFSVTESTGWHCKYHPQMTGTIEVA
jgi:plastocyanin